jgi:hypothetical protein
VPPNIREDFEVLYITWFPRVIDYEIFPLQRDFPIIYPQFIQMVGVRSLPYTSPLSLVDCAWQEHHHKQNSCISHFFFNIEVKSIVSLILLQIPHSPWPRQQPGEIAKAARATKSPTRKAQYAPVPRGPIKATFDSNWNRIVDLTKVRPTPYHPSSLRSSRTVWFFFVSWNYQLYDILLGQGYIQVQHSQNGARNNQPF